MIRKWGLGVMIITLVLAALACSTPWGTASAPTETQPPDQATASTSTTMPTSTATAEPSPSLPVFEDPVVFDFQFFTTMKGWGVTQQGSNLLITEDGGQTWLDATPTELFPLPADITSLSTDPFFLDESTAWFSPNARDSAVVYHTQDGGRNWETASSPFDNARFYFLNLEDGFAMEDLGAAAGSHYVALYKTSDGGNSWVQVFTHEPGESKSLPESGSKSGLTFLDEEKGWVGGVIPMTDYFYLYTTTDGGITWTQETDISLPPGFAGSMLEVWQPFFINGTTGYLPVRALASGGEMHLLLYRSDDSGETWGFQNAILDGRSLDFVAVDEGWAAAGTALYKTQDGGETWSTVSTNGIPAGEFFLRVEFVDSQHGWVLGTPNESTWNPLNLYRTTDGGANWTLLQP